MSNNRLALSIVSLIVASLLLSYAFVPLYNIFCKLTGFAGTTQVIQDFSNHAIGKRAITVNFDANVNTALPWKFQPEQHSIKVRTGENTLVFYTAENLSKESIIGTAVYNVTPHKAGQYFVKIECFCFEEQLLEAGQKMSMPVSFYIDPKIEEDPGLSDITQITLSYTFYKTK